MPKSSSLQNLRPMFLRFLLVGGSGFVIDVGLTYLLISLGVAPWLARPPAIASAAVFTWLANRQFTYRVRSQKSTQEAARYALVATLMAALNYAVYLVLLGLSVAPVLAVTLATAIQTVASFFAYRRFVFHLPR